MQLPDRHFFATAQSSAIDTEYGCTKFTCQAAGIEHRAVSTDCDDQVGAIDIFSGQQIHTSFC